jgi:putative ABC transport system permease protein
MAGIEAAVQPVDRNVLLERIDVLEQTVQTSVAPERFNMLLVVTFALLALTLAAVGIYGITAFSVSARRGEIRIRRALGASDQRVAAEIARRVAGLTAIGVVAGVIASSAGSRLLSSLVVEVQATDFWVIVSVALGIDGISGIAAVIPILRSTRIEPTEALRTE